MNNLKNLLNLKKKDPSDIVIVEKIVLKDRSIFFELARMLIIIAVASGVVWGISNADNLVKSVETVTPTKNFSAIGIVTEVATTTISIGDAKASDQSGNTTYTFDTSSVKKIETSNYLTLTLSDINPGDKIIVQGVDDGGAVEIRRIISFGGGVIVPTATTTEATTTTATSTATTTDSTASSTDASTTASTTDASSTPSILDNVSNTVSNVVGVVQGAVQNVINTITGSSTATSTDSTASTTVATSTQADSSTTAPVDIQTPTPDATPTPAVVAPDPTPAPAVVTPPANPTPTSDSSGSADSSTSTN